MPDLPFIVCVTERDIDLLVLEELAVNEDFCRWLVRRLPGEPHYQETLGVWHSVCDTTLGESDIVYAFVAATGKRIAVLIENKIDAPPQPEKAERYKQRGARGIDRGDWDDCVTCILAPTRYTVLAVLRGGRMSRAYFAFLILASVVSGGCTPAGPSPAVLPSESYERPAEAPHGRSDYIFRLSQMPSFYDVPGEFGHYMGGPEYGFEKLYFIITETHPCGGPPLHTHETEEAHVLIEGAATYAMGDQRLEATGPYIARVPAGLPHTFVNTGATPFRLVAVFSGDKPPSYSKVGDNPLVGTCSRE